MNSVEKLAELRRMAVQRGYPRELDRQFYVPVRTRTDGRSYIPANAESCLLWDPDWVGVLVGEDPEETMVELARTRARRGDTVGYLYASVKRKETDGKAEGP